MITCLQNNSACEKESGRVAFCGFGEDAGSTVLRRRGRVRTKVKRFVQDPLQSNARCDNPAIVTIRSSARHFSPIPSFFFAITPLTMINIPQETSFHRNFSHHEISTAATSSAAKQPTTHPLASTGLISSGEVASTTSPSCPIYPSTLSLSRSV